MLSVNAPFLETLNKLCIIKQQQIKYNQGDSFYALFPYDCFPFLCLIKFCRSCFRQVFFIWETKKVVAGCVRQVVSYTVMIVWEFAWVDSALVILDKWSSYKGGHLSRFDCITPEQLTLGTQWGDQDPPLKTFSSEIEKAIIDQ